MAVFDSPAEPACAYIRRALPYRVQQAKNYAAMNDNHFDLVIIGSGAAGLAAAVTARKHGLDVLVVEKEPFYGGTTARSGGWLWIPGNPLAREAGIADRDRKR